MSDQDTNENKKKTTKKILHKNKLLLDFHKFYTNSKKSLLNLLFPEDIKCAFCNADIPDFEERPYCDDCAKNLPFNNGHRCKICDQPIPNDETVCDFCKSRSRNFKKAFCPFLYEGKVREAVLAYKNSSQKYRAKAFAKLIFQCVKDVKVDFITFIPMTTKKQKIRTFNQSELLANELAKLMNVPVLSVFSKTRDLHSQKELNYRERQQNVIGTYSLKKINVKRTDNVLIVDDIITTCATVNYCAGLLYPKVNDIYVCAIAREYYKPKTGNCSKKFSFEK